MASWFRAHRIGALSLRVCKRRNVLRGPLGEATAPEEASETQAASPAMLGGADSREACGEGMCGPMGEAALEKEAQAPQRRLCR